MSQSPFFAFLYFFFETFSTKKLYHLRKDEEKKV